MSDSSSENRSSIYYPGSPYKVVKRYAVLDTDETGGWAIFEVEELASTKFEARFYPRLHELNIIVIHPDYGTNLPIVRFTVPPLGIYRQKSKHMKPKHKSQRKPFANRKPPQRKSSNSPYIRLQHDSDFSALIGTSGFDLPSLSMLL